ncbi:WapI family immunity protein [Janthinobacterium sp. PSPC3-1]|uniref:WapI family immunity protein n=1 Tax=Janthinobacterium sp. PSPC3-1 TaxID=2804653 RepID=UPI003CED03D5
MHQLHIGTATEFLRLEIEPAYPGWLRAQITIQVHGFNGLVVASFEPGDFEAFERELQALNTALAGVAEFSSRENQVTFYLRVNKLGHIDVSGEAWSQPFHNRNKLAFEFNIDQTFLPPILAQLGAINA